MKPVRDKARDRLTTWITYGIMPHEASARQWLRRRLSSRDDTDDLIQEAYARLVGMTAFEHIAEPRRYADEAITGAVIALRPGMKALLASVERGEVDLVLADELDRLSRSQSQTPMIYERLLFLGVRLHTIAEGEIGRLHVGLKGTMNAEQLAATSRKTRDAIAKRFRDGQNPGGLAYGYALDFVPDARGDRIPGHRRIVPEQAETVVYICEEYAGGRSPHDIAIELNGRGVPGPRGGDWSASTINGNKTRGTGILNNRLYIGQPEHQRQAELEAEMAAGAEEATPALLHPRLAQVYRGKVERLLQAFEAEGSRSEAQEIIRSLIDAVVMMPEGGVLHAEVKGDLATMLVLASETKITPKADAFEVQQVKMVAGTRLDRDRQLLTAYI